MQIRILEREHRINFQSMYANGLFMPVVDYARNCLTQKSRTMSLAHTRKSHKPDLRQNASFYYYNTKMAKRENLISEA